MAACPGVIPPFVNCAATRNEIKPGHKGLAFFGISAGSVTYPVIDALLAGDDRPDTDM